MKFTEGKNIQIWDLHRERFFAVWMTNSNKMFSFVLIFFTLHIILGCCKCFDDVTSLAHSGPWLTSLSLQSSHFKYLLQNNDNNCKLNQNLDPGTPIHYIYHQLSWNGLTQALVLVCIINQESTMSLLHPVNDVVLQQLLVSKLQPTQIFDALQCRVWF